MFGILGIGRIQLYIAAAVAIVGIYFFWKHNVEQQALMEYNQKQLEQSLVDQKKMSEALNDLSKQQADIIKKSEEDRQAYELKIGTISDYLESKETKKSDKPSSDILRNTVKQLKEISK